MTEKMKSKEKRVKGEADGGQQEADLPQLY